MQGSNLRLVAAATARNAKEHKPARTCNFSFLISNSESQRAISSVVEHLLHTQGVAGSIPASRISSERSGLRFRRRVLFRDMSEHKMTLTWKRGDAPFDYQKYPRNHTWKFDGGHEMTASAAPAYLGDPKNVDPEEAFVASLSACHMLTFLAIACKQKFVLDEYVDEAVGHMEKNTEGRLAITKVELHPTLKWGDKEPSAEELGKMHHMAHEQCF